MRTVRCLAAALLLLMPRVGAAPISVITPITGGVRWVVVNRGDTLSSLAARHGVDARTLARDNQRSLTAPLAAGQPLLIDNRHIVPAVEPGGPIVVNVPQRMLFFAGPDGTVTGLPVAVGRANWRTPLGGFIILTAEANPTWDVPASILAEARRAGRTLPAHVPPGPANPLGRYWLGLNVGGIGIHGTNAPASIYRITTHGCIRLHPDDIAWLFSQVMPGTSGHIVYEPVMLAVADDGIYVEAHPDAYGLGGDPLARVRQQAREHGVEDLVEWPLAAQVLAARDGIARIVGRQR